MIAAARDVGLADDAVPDFLGALYIQADASLVGQEEIVSDEVGIALVEGESDLHKLDEAFGFDKITTSRLVEQRIRLGQHRFASQVLAAYDHHCGFCGFSPGELRGHRLLVASHIKPWATSTDSERLTPKNGIAACPVHDSAFDTGLLTVTNDLHIRRSTDLAAQLSIDRGLARYFGSDVVGDSRLMPSPVSRPRHGSSNTTSATYSKASDAPPTCTW